MSCRYTRLEQQLTRQKIGLLIHAVEVHIVLPFLAAETTMKRSYQGFCFSLSVNGTY